MEDQSIFNPNNTSSDTSILTGRNNNADQEYINQCIKEVCHRGDSLQKYQRMIEKKFGPEYYKKCENFVEEVNRSVGRKKFSNTTVVNLKYLANEIHVPVETVDGVISHYTKLFEKEEREKEEAERKRLERIAEEKRREEEKKRREEEEERQRRQRMAEEAEKRMKKQLIVRILKWVLCIGVVVLLVIFWYVALGIAAIVLLVPYLRENIGDFFEWLWDFLTL